jgi:hypothetical protein
VTIYSDSDWAENPGDRKSVGCFIIIFLNGVPVAWRRSRLQKLVSLSSSEAEFYACAKAVKEVPYWRTSAIDSSFPRQCRPCLVRFSCFMRQYCRCARIFLCCCFYFPDSRKTLDYGIGYQMADIAASRVISAVLAQHVKPANFMGTPFEKPKSS